MNRAIAVTLLVISLLVPSQAMAGDEIIINAVGDVMLAGRWTPLLKRKGYDFPFGGVAAELARGDISLANLESPIATCGTECLTKRFRFRAEPEVAAALRRAGFSVVTLANNHSMDFGEAALAETLRHLADAGIAAVGAGINLDVARKPAFVRIKGKRIAFLGYSLTQPVEFFAGAVRPGTAPGYEKLVRADVTAARQQADFVIVSFHWGREASNSVQEYQRTAAHHAIEAGADVIIGHHPHVLQGVERYKQGIIFYSLGNFAFAAKSTTADASAIIRLRLGDSRREADVLPLDVLHRRVGFQPQLLAGERADAVIRKLNGLSRTFRTEILVKNGRYTVPF